MNKHWIVVASAEHVQRGRAAGFIQAGHGKASPLRRMKAGDGVICYSPTSTFGGKDRLQAFTSIGTIKDDKVYQADMGGISPVPSRPDLSGCGPGADRAAARRTRFDEGQPQLGIALPVRARADHTRRF
ncbi:MAG: EVE domain-containing protein [Xanthobacteraceae bacterium]